MAKDYIFQAPWSSFFLDNELCDLSHLNEYRLSAEDSDGESRDILVTFSDHCFTDKEPADPLQPQKYLYPYSARRPSWAKLHQNLGADYQRVRKFREKAILSLQAITKVYPDLRLEQDEVSLAVHSSLTPIKSRFSSPGPLLLRD